MQSSEKVEKRMFVINPLEIVNRAKLRTESQRRVLIVIDDIAKIEIIAPQKVCIMLNTIVVNAE